MKKCVFAGTFDPPTVGHEDIVLKSLEIFDEVVVAVLINPNKLPMLTIKERETLLNKVFASYKNVRVVSHSGLLVDLLRKENTKFYVRGVRNSTDYEYETLENYINSDMYGDLLTLYLPTRQKLLHISSSLVKDAITFGMSVDEYIPKAIRSDIKELSKKAALKKTE